jgi:type II secretory pathway component PulF
MTNVLRKLWSLLGRPLKFMLDGFPTMDRQALQPLIRVAHEQRLELPGLVEAFAEESSPWRRPRLRRLARRLRSGAKLGDAIEMTPHALPLGTLFAVRVGGEMGTLDASLKLSQPAADRATSAAIGRITDAAIYAVTLAVIGGLWLGFSLVKLHPVLQQVCAEFDLPESVGAMRLNRLADWGGPLTFLYLILIPAAIWFIGSGSLGRSLRHGWLAWTLGIQQSSSIADSLEQFAVATEAGRPPALTLDALARHHHSARIAKQLRQARDRLSDLPSIWTAFESIGYLTKPESNALAASEPIGNTAWVLRQFVEKRRRRHGLRLQLLSQLVIPAMVILFGGGLVFVATGLLGPTFSIGAYIP